MAGHSGSFTIKAKTVDPVASESNHENAFGYDWGDIGSTFSITVQMGADRYYGGAIFETNVIGLDTGFSKLSDPYDQAFSFDLKGLPGTATKVRALMPKSVLNHQFMIWEASEVKAGIADPENGIRFVRGSRNSDQEADDPDLVGYGFHRILHKGRELDMYMPGYGSITGPDDDEFLLVDNELFGFDSSVLNVDESSQRRSASTGRRSAPTTWSSAQAYTQNTLVVDGGYTYISLQDVPAGITTNNTTYWSSLDILVPTDSPSESDTLATLDDIPVSIESIASRFDFDGDSYADSLVEVSFDAEVFPGDVQIGNPYVDPFKGIDLDKLGSISGKIYIDDENGSITLDGFMVEFFTEVNDPFMGVSYREYAMVADFKSENGEYHAKLLPGEYQVEAWGWGYDDKIDQPINFRPQIALEANGNPKTYLVVNEKDKYSKVDFILQEEYTLSWDQEQVTAQLLNIETPDLPVEVWGAFLDLTPVDPKNTDLALTDYPMWSVHIDYNGSINQSVPEGTFRVDLVSHGNPMKLDQESKLIWTVKKGEINNFGVLKVKLQDRFSVSGKFTNENGEPVWAEVLFVDPDDEYNYYWPEWEPVGDYNPLTGGWIEPEPGTYSVRAYRKEHTKF